MAYNKAKEERKWRIWKEGEEKELRQLGVDEDIINQLREHDWEVFNSDRKFYRRMNDMGTCLDGIKANEVLPEIRTVEDLLDDIENETLHHSLIAMDKLTLQIALWKINGYSSKQISRKTGLSVNAVNMRIWRLKEKLKKFI